MSEFAGERRWPRIPCDLPMGYEIKGVGFRDGRILNIGVGGVLLDTLGAIPHVGADLLLRFDLPLTKRPIATGGKVKWATEGKAGVEFLQLSLQQQDEIWRYYARESARQRQAPS